MLSTWPHITTYQRKSAFSSVSIYGSIHITFQDWKSVERRGPSAYCLCLRLHKSEGFSWWFQRGGNKQTTFRRMNDDAQWTGHCHCEHGEKWIGTVKVSWRVNDATLLCDKVRHCEIRKALWRITSQDREILAMLFCPCVHNVTRLVAPIGNTPSVPTWNRWTVYISDLACSSLCCGYCWTWAISSPYMAVTPTTFPKGKACKKMKSE